MKHCEMGAFSVIGMLGSTSDGEGFVNRLWDEATSRFSEIEPLVARDENGAPLGFWGLMSDMSGAFKPWEDGFSKGLYLAGAQVTDSATPPEGWVKWTVPASEYIAVKMGGDIDFNSVISYMNDNGIPLVGAVYDFNDPSGGGFFNYFPVKRL